jgi:uncharacterized protein (TIGR00251 family)
LVSVTDDATWHRYDAVARRFVLTLHVQPNARKSAFAGLHGGALKVKIAAPAINNEANLELVRFLSEAIGAPRSAIYLRRGAASRRKVVEIAGGEELLLRLSELQRDSA